MIRTTVLVLALGARCALAAPPPSLLSDLVREPIPSPSFPAVLAPFGFVQAGERLYFSTRYESPEGQCALWSFARSQSGLRRLAVEDATFTGQCFRPLGALGETAIFQTPGGFLWGSDGTRAGTGPLFDRPLAVVAALESADSNVRGGPYFLFQACLDLSLPQSCGLWRTDGTRGGTGPLERLSGSAFVLTLGARRFQGRVYFVARLGEQGGVWESDGTDEGTVLFASTHGPGTDDSALATTASTLFFSSEGVEGVELWASEGTRAGTRRVGLFAPAGCERGDCSPFLDRIQVVGDEVVFNAHDGAHALELWHSDGTLAGTRRLSDLPDDLGPRLDGVQRVDERWIFAADRALEGRRSLWTSLGDAASTAPLPVCAGTDCAEVEAIFPQESQPPGYLLFVAADPLHGDEPWASDGTAAGTRRLADICPGTCGSFVGFEQLPAPPSAEPPVVAYFAAKPRADAQGTLAEELWASDGTPEGTERISAIGVPALGRLEERIFFGIADPALPSFVIEASDGSAAGTVEVARSGPAAAETSQGSAPSFWPARRGMLVLATSGMRQQVWLSDGTPERTQPIPGLTGELDRRWFARQATRAGSWTYFERARIHSPDPYRAETELWRSDGTIAGTALLVRFGLNQGIDPWVRADWNGRFLFLVGGPKGLAFWLSDGTTVGTHESVPLPPGVRSPTALQPFGDRFYFVARVERRGGPVPQLFVSDGTPEGTHVLSSIEDSREALQGTRMAAVGGDVFFLLFRPIFRETELWVTDGTPAGTKPAFRQLAEPADLFAWRGALYFTARAGVPADRTRALYRWTVGGAVPVALALADPGERFARDPVAPNLTPAGGQLFFSGHDALGDELWVTDGTPAGTRLVRDLRPGLSSSSPALFTASGGRLYFTARDSVHGRELWTSDGTEAGTRMIVDLRPGFLSAMAQTGIDGFALWRGKLFFAADDGVHGTEPWVLEAEP